MWISKPTTTLENSRLLLFRFGLFYVAVTNHGNTVCVTYQKLYIITQKTMATRRLAILSSHLCPISPTPMSSLSVSDCSSGSENQPRLCDAIKETQQNDCVFCQIIRGESPSIKLYEDDMCLCFLDKNPLCHGHSLIIPKSHFASLEVTPPQVIAAMCSKVPLISSAIMKATGCESFNLLVNNGAPAGQVIFHTHIHVIPRKACDCLWTSESFRRRPLKFDQEASRLADRVREQLINIS